MRPSRGCAAVLAISAFGLACSRAGSSDIAVQQSSSTTPASAPKNAAVRLDCAAWPRESAELERLLLALTAATRAHGGACPGSSDPGPRRTAAPPVLTLSPTLQCAARLNSADMAATGVFAHRNLAGEGPAERARRAGYRGTRVLENLAWGQSTAEQVVNAWLSSPEHCVALFSESSVEVGAGFALGAADKPFWTLLLGAGDREQSNQSAAQ